MTDYKAENKMLAHEMKKKCKLLDKAFDTLVYLRIDDNVFIDNALNVNGLKLENGRLKLSVLKK